MLGEGRDWLAQCHDNVTKGDIRSWYWQPGVPLGKKPYKVTMSALSQVGTPPDMTLDVART